MMNRLADILMLHTVRPPMPPPGIESAVPEADQSLKQDSLRKD